MRASSWVRVFSALAIAAALWQAPAVAFGQTIHPASFKAAASRQDEEAKRNAMHFLKAIGVVADGVLEASKKTPLGYDDGLCLFGAFIQNGRAATVERTFLRGVNYAIIGGGDDDAIDVDLEIRDEDGDVVVKDEDLDAEPVVIFRPRATGRYWVKLALDKSDANGSFCAMAIMKGGGWNVPPNNMVLACGKSMVSYVGACRLLGGLKFLDAPNQWSFFGGVLREGEQHGLKNITLGKGDRVFLASGDDHAADIDLYLKSQSGAIIDKDEDEDATPYLRFRAQPAQSYGVQVVNADADGPSMVVCIILTK